MIVRYDKTVFNLTNAILGNDAATIAELIATKYPFEEVFVTTDDANVVASTNLYYVGEDGFGSPTGVNARNFVGVSASSSTYMLNEFPVIAVQIRDGAGAPLAVSGVSVRLNASVGLLDADTVVTNGSGAGTTTYFPSKQLGASIFASAPLHIGGTVSLAFLPPTTDAQQNWIESADIRPGAVTAAKLSSDINVTPSPISTADGQIVSNINSVAIDPSYIYVNGYTGVITPTIVRFYKDSFLYDGVPLTYVNNNLAAGFDGMMHDGTDLWVAAGGDLMQVNTAVSGMTITNTFVIDATGGSLQFVVDESSTELWTFLRGGASANANKILRITKATGAVAAAVTIGGAQAAHDRPQAAILGNYLYACNPDGSNFYVRVNRSTNVRTFSGYPNNNSSLACAADGVTFWTGGLTDVSWDSSSNVIAGGGSLAWSTSTMTTQYPDEYNKVGVCYRLAYDGVENVWGLCDGDIARSGTQPRKYLAEFIRSVEYDGGSGSMLPITRLGRLIDLSATVGTVVIEPHAIAASGNFLYTGNWQGRNPSAGENVSRYRFK